MCLGDGVEQPSLVPAALRRGRLFFGPLDLGRNTQLRRHRQLKHVLPEQAGREEQHLQTLNRARAWIQAGESVVAKLF